MPRKRIQKYSMRISLTHHPGITSRSSATEKTPPRLPKISQWCLRSTTFHSTQFTEHSLLAVRDLRDRFLLRAYWPLGSDGTVNFWDKDARTRLKGDFVILSNVFRCLILLRPRQIAFDPSLSPVSATAFNRNGNIFAYAISYDWSKGHSGMTPGHPNKIMLHACKEEEVKKRPPKR
jgi:mRNA export factor